MLLIEEYGDLIEADLWKYAHGWDLLDFFRGRHPWPQLWRFLANGCPPESQYHAALAMDEEIGRARAMQPRPETRGPISPAGYSLPVLLQLRVIDLLKEVMRVIPASFSGKMPPPFPPEPRPQTAEERIRDEIETLNLNSAIDLLLGRATT